MPAKKTTNGTTTKAARDEARESQRAAAVARYKRKRQIYSVVIFAAGILLIAFSFVGDSTAESPTAWDSIHTFLRGIFGLSVFAIGPALIYASVMIARDKRKSALMVKMLQLGAIVLLVTGAVQILFVGDVAGFGEVYSAGVELRGGGIIGMALAYPLMFFGRVGASIIVVLIGFVFIMLMGNITLDSFLRFVAYPFRKLGQFVRNQRELHRQERLHVEEMHRESRQQESLAQLRAMSGAEKPKTKAERLSEEEEQRKIEEEIARDVENEINFSQIVTATAPPKSVNLNKTGSPAEEGVCAAVSLLKPAPQESAGTVAESGEFDDDPPFDIPGGVPPLVVPSAAGVADKSDGGTPSAQVIPPLRESGGYPTSPPVYITPDSAGVTPHINGDAAAGAPVAVAERPDGEQSSDAFDAAVVNYQKEIADEELARLQREQSFSEPEKTQSDFDALAKFAEHQQLYSLPGVDLLDEIVNKRSDADIQAELDGNSNKLVETLKSFGVIVRIVGVVRGPSVTRYEIQPAPGVKISKITGLTDDIALNLAAAGVRMEAPIPGKSAVGVEVPNHTVDTVTFRELIDSNDFRETNSNLGAVIGKAISGDIIVCDIAKMPHLLIAGTTGSGKSVCVNSIIMSILYRATPEEIRLMMIDPKTVEFAIYSGIPHLLTPVVTDPKKAAGALKWAVTEMTRRYSQFAEHNVRDIGGYNEVAKNSKGSESELEPMAKIVIFIDELADLMMTAAREVEESICRLAQMARAAGIHLVIATQRPTVNVVTGLIKANIPSRIALKVASQVDSRTIIDTAGADKLLGRGDMLYSPVGIPKPVRVQGCWVSDKEVDRVVRFVKDNFDFEYDESVIAEIELEAEKVADKSSKGGDTIDDDFEMDDDKLEDAIEAVIDAGKASTSYLQLKLKLGYGRAARLIDIMERMGVIGKSTGASRPREVLMTREDWLIRKNNMT